MSIVTRSHIIIDKDVNALKEQHLFSSGVIELKGDKFVPVAKCERNEIKLKFALPESVRLKSKFILHAGCDKKFSTCSKIYNNAINFRGEPHVPGLDEIHKTAGTFR